MFSWTWRGLRLGLISWTSWSDSELLGTIHQKVLKLFNYQNLKDLHINLSVTLKGINSTDTKRPLIWAFTNYEIWTVKFLRVECNVSMCLSAGLRLILLCMYSPSCVNRIRDIHVYQSRSNNSLALFLCFWVFLCSLSFHFSHFSFPFTAISEFLKVHCQYLHGNCHLCATCSCHLFTHLCWLTVNVEEFCVFLCLHLFQINASLMFTFPAFFFLLFRADVCKVYQDVLWFL